MKNLLIAVIILVSASMSFAQENQMTKKEKKAARKAEQVAKTKALIEANAWQFDANHMLPTSGRSRTLTTPYNVVVKDGQLDSYLPYFGRAYSVDYGSTESPLIFKSEISDYTVKPGKKGGWIITFKTTNKNDNLDYLLTISENGSGTLSINSTNRQAISFHGDLADIEAKDKE